MSVQHVQFDKVNRHVCPNCDELLTAVPGQLKVLQTEEKAYVVEETFRCAACNHVERWIAKDPGTAQPSLSMIQHQNHKIESRAADLANSMGWLKLGMLLAVVLLGVILYEDGTFHRYLG